MVNLTTLLLAGAAVIVCIGVVFALRSRRRRSELPDPPAPPGATKKSSPGAPQIPGTATKQESESLDRVKLVVHGLLQGVSDNIETLLDEGASYEHSLVNHALAIQKSKTVAGLRDLEKVMLSELRSVQETNVRYRRELDAANKTTKTQQKELEKLQTDVGVDFLTKIPNRRAFHARFTEEMERAKRYGSGLSMVVIDVDHFKGVNDRNGHLAGDRILRGIANLLEGSKRASDYLARFGGEEFVLLLPETTLEQARNLAETTRKRVAKSKFRYERTSIRVTVSSGVGEFDTESDTMDTFFTRIDKALFQAKKRGRNRVEVATSQVKTS